jgi:chromosome partitioning protein
MAIQEATREGRARVIVVGNEKGGSGKSTVAMHIAIALLKSGQRVATIDLDSRQKSFTNYIENRRSWARHISRDLEIPDHVCIDAANGTDDEATKALTDAIGTLTRTHDYIIIDTPGHEGSLTRFAHSTADSLITPLNDSFVDFDVLGTVDAETFAVTGNSHYSRMVEEARRRRLLSDGVSADWIVLRNRLSMLGTRNKRQVGESLQELSQKLNFRCVDGLAERMIFREFFPRGLTALDDLNEGTLGTRPTLSHASARQEVENLLNAMRLGAATASEMPSQNRDAA